MDRIVTTEQSKLVNPIGNKDVTQEAQPPSYLDIFKSYPTNAKVAYGISSASNVLAVASLIPVVPLMGSCWNFTGGCIPGYVLLACALGLGFVGNEANNAGNRIMNHHYYLQASKLQ